MIEWLPRWPRDGNGWRDSRGTLLAGEPHPGTVRGRTGVVVPVHRREPESGSYGRPALAAAGGTAVGVYWGFEHGIVFPTVGAAVVGLSGITAAARRWAALRRHPSLRVDETGIETGGLFVPWSVVEAVVAHTARGGRGRGDTRPSRNLLALRVSEFDNVQGLTPVRAGAANLTRRRLLMVAEAAELRRPRETFEALRLLVRRPEARLLLAGPEGVRLFTEGTLHLD
ncbi:hypothetical protein [Lapillicoccus jejuensis]|uniref:Uncharacterized protein n=1 Tax=Lapillicoccus jejuensis TaxID=402171 RepID=A0A542E2Z6_9MICO|nr:hypothetical protein [Lapillicoccus jejuensis]TQJ09703.1 hypothetical protein FB458_2816 [Lapillicoccus jejuensis]